MGVGSSAARIVDNVSLDPAELDDHWSLPASQRCRASSSISEGKSATSVRTAYPKIAKLDLRSSAAVQSGSSARTVSAQSPGSEVSDKVDVVLDCLRCEVLPVSCSQMPRTSLPPQTAVARYALLTTCIASRNGATS